MSHLSQVIFASAATLLFAISGHLSAADDHHDHGHDHSHGPLQTIGNVTLGAVIATVEGAGTPTPGQEWHVTVDLPAGSAAPKAIRVWVGIENGRGSEKAKAAAEPAHPGGYEAHVAVPAPLPEGSKLWISLESAGGESSKGALALPAAPADAHHGHAP